MSDLLDVPHRFIAISILLLFTLLLLDVHPTHAASLTVDAATPYVAADGECSLIEAIDNANNDAQTHADCPAGSGTDTVTLNTDINLDGTDTFTQEGPNGLPPITSNIIIQGNNKTITRDGGGPSFRILYVAAGANLTLKNLTVSNGLLTTGFDNGGGIFNRGTLTVMDTTVTNSRVEGINPGGGGIYNQTGGVLTLINSRISNNAADNTSSVNFKQGGGIYNLGTLTVRNSNISVNDSCNQGGGIYSTGNLTIENSTISGNTSREVAGGLYVNFASTNRIYNSTFSNNAVNVDGSETITFLDGGGAIFTSSDDFEIFGSVFRGNTTGGTNLTAGGAIRADGSTFSITNSLFENNQAMNNGIGGAIVTVDSFGASTTTITASIIRNNSTPGDGGGLYGVGANIIIRDSLISENTANNGGGIYQAGSNVGGIRVERSTVRDNEASFIGGGFASVSASAIPQIINSTFTGNTATTLGSGIGLNSGGLVDVQYSTIAENTSPGAGNTGGISAFGGEMTIGGTIIANNTDRDCSATGSSTSEDYNVSPSPQAGSGSPFDPFRWCSFIDNAPNDLPNTDPLLDPLSTTNLQSYYTLGTGSPAIDLAPSCPAELDGIDQRGVPREAGSCDAGSISSEDVLLPQVRFDGSTATIDDEGSFSGTQNVNIIIDNTAGNLTAPGSLPLTVYLTVKGTASNTDDYSLGVGIPTTFILNAVNWVAPGDSDTVSVPISVIDDALTETDETIELELSVIGPGELQSGQSNYTVTILDDDTPGFTLSETAAETDETGNTDTFTVVLDTEPIGNVVLTVTSADEDEVTVDLAEVTFSPDNWDTPQEITLTGVDDPDVDGDQTVNVTISIDAANSADDFDALADQTVSVTNLDDETADIPGFTLSETTAETSEQGTTATFTVVLDSQPTTDVALTVTSADTDEVTVDVTTLTFTSADWDTPQTVTLTGVDDADADGDQTVDVTVSVDDANSDDNFDDLDDQTVTVTNRDDDTAGFTLSKTTAETDETGTTDTFTIVLNTQPTSNVVLTIISDDTTEVTANLGAVAFTPTDWDTPQTITLTGVDDDDVDGDQTVDVTISVDDTTSDDAFDGLDDQTVSVTNLDDDDDNTNDDDDDSDDDDDAGDDNNDDDDDGGDNNESVANLNGVTGSTSTDPSDAPVSASAGLIVTNIDGTTSGSTGSAVTIQFNRAVRSGTDANGAENPDNYVLTSPGVDGGFDRTLACRDWKQATPATDDVRLTNIVVSLSPDGTAVTLQFQPPLAPGLYRLLVCGTSSIVAADGGTVLNNGAFDGSIEFTVGEGVTGIEMLPTTLPVEVLPATGQTPWWRGPLLALVGVVSGVLVALWGYRRRGA